MSLLFYTNCDGRIIILTDFSDLHVFPHWYQDNSVPSSREAFLYSPFKFKFVQALNHHPALKMSAQLLL